MTDREMLELAALAGGYEVQRSRLDDPLCNDLLLVKRTNDGRGIGWNPLTDDGDALRLAVRLRLDVGFAGDHVESGNGAYLEEPLGNGDNDAATRRAITRAAAEIGKAMKAGAA